MHRHPVHGLRRLGLHPRRRQGARQARDARPRDPDARLLRLQRDRVQGAGRRAGAAGDRGAPRVPDRRQARRQGSALGIKFARTPADGPGGAGGRVLLRPQGAAGAPRRPAASWRCRSSTDDGAPRALPIVEAVPEQEDFYDFEARYEIGRTRFVCPAELDDGARASARGRSPSRSTRCSAAPGFARVDLMLESASDELYVLEVNAIPGLTETSLLPQAAEAAGIGFDELIERILERALRRCRGRRRGRPLPGRSTRRRRSPRA